ncbi:MAG: hypothetical protein JSU07_12985 [Bacteroidetes bacterium]|nr:hypothetical protein [Bacteroidota bacterium]
MKYLLTFLSLFSICFEICAQEKINSQCSSILIDPQYKGGIKIYDKPGGNQIKIVKHNFTNEDFLFATIYDENDSMFYVTVSYEISGDIANGWIKKGDKLGIYTKYYTALALYTEPNKESKVKIIIKKYTNSLFEVASCKNHWLKVLTKIKGKKICGWLAPEFQCANPYTTCN